MDGPLAHLLQMFGSFIDLLDKESFLKQPKLID